MIYFKSLANQKVVAGSRSISHMLHIYSGSEPSTSEMVEASKQGIYLGRSEKLFTPVFLDQGLAINPHIFVAGITGSGKSYLMKSIMLRMNLVTDLCVVVIDFTGEYRDFSDFGFCKIATPETLQSLISKLARSLIYLDLSDLDEEEKVKIAQQTLSVIVRRMRKFKADGELRMAVMLDEAWKVLKNDSVLEIVIREGRKYGVGIILASQILSDVEKDFLQNIGTLFVFRLQNSEGISGVLNDYNLKQSDLERLQNFEVGKCLFIQINKFKVRSCFVISKIDGVRLSRPIRIDIEDTVLEVEETQFYKILDNIHVDRNFTVDLKAEINKAGSINLCSLIRSLLKVGVSGKNILDALRSFGFEDPDIADSFSVALNHQVLK